MGSSRTRDQIHAPCISRQMLYHWATREALKIFSFKSWDFLGGSVIKHPPASAGDARDACSIPESGRSPGVGNGNPLQYSCLGNSMDKQLQSTELQRIRHNWAYTPASKREPEDVFKVACKRSPRDKRILEKRRGLMVDLWDTQYPESGTWGGNRKGKINHWKRKPRPTGVLTAKWRRVMRKICQMLELSSKMMTENWTLNSAP